MGVGVSDDRGALGAALEWWLAAGVDTLVDEQPRDWLARVAPLPSVGSTSPARATGAAPAVAPAPAPAWPASLPELHGWLSASDAVPGDPPRGQRLAPAGDPASGLMIVIDMPEEGDVDAGALLQGAAGLLFDRMMAAIGRDRGSLYLAPFAPARVPGGRIGDDAAPLAALMRHHIALAAPRAVLVMGDGAASPLLGTVAGARAGLRALNLDGGSVASIATFHPRFLLARPALKAAAWADLRLLMGALTR